jgi:hypothetical protein
MGPAEHFGELEKEGAAGKGAHARVVNLLQREDIAVGAR